MPKNTALRLAIPLLAASLGLLAEERQETLHLSIDAACDIRDESTAMQRSVEQGASVVRGVSRFTYRIRSSRDAGSGQVSLRREDPHPQAETRFAAVAVGPGIGVSGVAPRDAAEFVVVRFGAGAHSSSRGAAAEVRWEYTLSALDATKSYPAPLFRITCR